VMGPRGFLVALVIVVVCNVVASRLHVPTSHHRLADNRIAGLISAAAELEEEHPNSAENEIKCIAKLQFFYRLPILNWDERTHLPPSEDRFMQFTTGNAPVNIKNYRTSMQMDADRLVTILGDNARDPLDARHYFLWLWKSPLKPEELADPGSLDTKYKPDFVEVTQDAALQDFKATLRGGQNDQAIAQWILENYRVGDCIDFSMSERDPAGNGLQQFRDKINVNIRNKINDKVSSYAKPTDENKLIVAINCMHWDTSEIFNRLSAEEQLGLMWEVYEATIQVWAANVDQYEDRIYVDLLMPGAVTSSMKTYHDVGQEAMRKASHHISFYVPSH